ncbi:MAG: prephenate dehydrogenase/arogenate dehydrogenase family protein [Pseudomonadota bacterium]|nr:prephenate dehydrogenase/arogenate dehydrogenase family protein [Pseudomonadota bacterium]
MKRIHIIGGGSGIGRWLAEKVFSLVGETFCYDLSLKFLEQLPKTIQRCHIETPDDLSAFSYNFQQGDWILFAVPEPALVSSIKSVCMYVQPDSLLIVSTSTQVKSLSALTEITPAHCCCLGFHPLFGPATTGPIGQLSALTGYSEALAHHVEFHNELTRIGLVVSTLSAEQHDKSMALIQALTHFCLIGFAATIGSNGIHPSELLTLKTPNFQFLFAFASRVLKLTPMTTGQIQCTQDAIAIRESFLTTVTNLHRAFIESGTAENAAKVIEAARAPLAGAEVDEGVETASIAVDGLQRFEELLHIYKTQDRPFVFFHRTNGTIHIVRITDIRVDAINYEESTRFLVIDGHERIAFGLFETARENYRNIGVNLKALRKETIKKRNIKLLSHNEYDRFYKDKVLPIRKTLNINNPYRLTEEYIESVLPLAIKGLWKCEFVDANRRRNEVEKIKIVAYLNPNMDISIPIAELQEVIENGKLTTRSTGPRETRVHFVDAGSRAAG